MTNQSISAPDAALGLPVDLPADTAIARVPRHPSNAMIQRASKYAHMVRGGPPVLIPAELIAAHVVTLPKVGARQRSALLTYAVEDRVAAPIDSVQVVQGPLRADTAGQVLALVLTRDIFAVFEAQSAPVLPDFFLIPRPVPPSDGAAWAVWRDGNRVLVRQSDGTGFAASADMLAMLWARAGKPLLFSLGEALPNDLTAQDLSENPPPPDPADMAFSLARIRRDSESRRSIALFVGSAVIAALVIHMALALFDLSALQRLAQHERARAQAAIAGPLPGIALEGGDVDAILSRLAPVAATQSQGAFLPLLSDVTAAMVGLPTPISFRRLAWGAQENSLSVLIEGSGLDDLQQLQQLLEQQGFTVRSGAANASGGAAEVDMRISRGTTQ